MPRERIIMQDEPWPPKSKREPKKDIGALSRLWLLIKILYLLVGIIPSMVCAPVYWIITGRSSFIIVLNGLRDLLDEL